MANTELIALIPMAIAQRHLAQGGIKILDMPMPIKPFTASMAWSPKVHHDPANRWLRSVVVDTVRDRHPGGSVAPANGSEPALAQEPTLPL